MGWQCVNFRRVTWWYPYRPIYGTWVAPSNFSSTIELSGLWHGKRAPMERAPILYIYSRIVIHESRIHINYYIFMTHDETSRLFKWKAKDVVQDDFICFLWFFLTGMFHSVSQVKSLEFVKQLISWKATMCWWKWSYDCRSWRMWTLTKQLRLLGQVEPIDPNLDPVV